MTTLTHLGKYHIKRQLGNGSMGVVYEAFDPMIERTVAIKAIAPSQLKGTEGAAVLARFKREAQAAGRLNHPNIVAIYEYGEVIVQSDSTLILAPHDTPVDKRTAFIAMEFVKGKELGDYLEADGRHFSLPEVARIMGEMLDALDHAHSNGVVHRDMKPENVILLDSGKVKVADFGIARIESSQLTQVGTIMGTPSYMSPEQFMGMTVDGRSDIFSCGVILYQLLTGEKPFTGSHATIMYKVLRQEPLPPSLLNVGLPVGLDLVVQTALAKNPDDRYESAGEFAQAIRDAVYGLTVSSDFALLQPESPSNFGSLSGAQKPQAKPVAMVENTAISARAAPHTSGTQPAPTLQVPHSEQGGKQSKTLLYAGAAAGLILVASAVAWFSVGTDKQTELAQQQQTPPASETLTKVPPDVVPPDAVPPALVPPVVVRPAVVPMVNTPPTETAAAVSVVKKDVEPAAPPTGGLRLELQNAWATVIVDGQEKGVSPPLLSLKLPAGTYDLELRNPAFPAYKRAVTVTAGKNVTVRHSFVAE